MPTEFPDSKAIQCYISQILPRLGEVGVRDAEIK